MSSIQSVLASSEMFWNLPWFAWVAIVAISFGCVSGMVSACFTHRERMAMIRMGMHPDSKDARAASVEKDYQPQDAEL